MFDPASLTIGQRNRLVALARAGKSLPWGRSDDALEQKYLVRKYRGAFNEQYADLTGDGLAAAQIIMRKGKWMPRVGSNHDYRSQSAVSYH